MLEAAPSLLLSVVVATRLTDRPAAAAWLDDTERRWLVERLESERRARDAEGRFGVLQALVNSKVLLLSAVYFGIVSGNYGLTFFLPQIVKPFGFSYLQAGFVTAVPYAAGTIAMIIWARRSDRTGEHRLHTTVALGLAGVGLIGAAFFSGTAPMLIALTVAAIGIFAAMPVFWALPTEFLSGAAAAGGTALINSIGNLSGFAGPYAMGWFKEATGSYTAGLLSLASLAGAAAALVLLGTRARGRRPGSRQ